jgi:hypothetical protein
MMNHNLHQVCLQAQARARELACERNGVENPQQHTVYNEFVQVYADMLLRECMALAQQVAQEYRDMHCDSHDRESRSALYAGQDAAAIVRARIQDHFEVSE